MAEFWLQITHQLAQWLRPYLSDFAMMIMATLLVIYGDNINRALKRQLAGMHFVFRTLAFVLICAFGYGLLVIWLTPIIAQLLAQLPNSYLAPVCVGVLLGVGLLAESKRQI